MKYLLYIILTTISFQGISQSLFQPEQKYDPPGGLFEMDSVRALEIHFEAKDYHDILLHNWQAKNGERLPATIRLSNGTELKDVAIRYKGNSTLVITRDRDNPKIPFNIDLNDWVGGQELMGYNKLKLANNILDPTFCKEVLAWSYYRKFLPASEANFMKLFVEGEYLGLYSNIETVNAQFLKKHFGESGGVLIKGTPVQRFGDPPGGPVGRPNFEWLGEDSTLYYHHYELKSSKGWKELVELTDIMNHRPEELPSILNIDRILWAFAVNTVVLNLDTYNGLYQHNYYLYQTPDGLFQMIPWDLSEAFLGSVLGHHPNPQELYEYDPFLGYNSWWQPLTTALITDPDTYYGKLFAAHIRTVLEEFQDSSLVRDQIINLQTIISASADTDPNTLFHEEAFQQNIEEDIHVPDGLSIASFMDVVEKRKQFLSSHPGIARTPPVITGISLSNSKEKEEVMVHGKVSGADSVWLMATTSAYHSRFTRTRMYDDGTHGDSLSGDDIYSIPLPYQHEGRQINYYLIAENKEAIEVNPRRAAYEFYVHTPENHFQTDHKPVIYPNPFTQTTRIRYYLEREQQVQLEIFDIYGKKVATLVKEIQSTGLQEIVWEPVSLRGGSYFYRLKTGAEQYTGKLLLLR